MSLLSSACIDRYVRGWLVLAPALAGLLLPGCATEHRLVATPAASPSGAARVIDPERALALTGPVDPTAESEATRTARGTDSQPMRAGEDAAIDSVSVEAP